MSTGTKIVKSGSEPPTPFEIEVSQVTFPFPSFVVKFPIDFVLAIR